MTCSRGILISLFFNDTATTEIYTLSLHDALPISREEDIQHDVYRPYYYDRIAAGLDAHGDRKSTRLNSSHMSISYAVFCLKKKTRVRAVVRRERKGPGCCLRPHAVRLGDGPENRG